MNNKQSNKKTKINDFFLKTDLKKIRKLNKKEIKPTHIQNIFINSTKINIILKGRKKKQKLLKFTVTGIILFPLKKISIVIICKN